MATDMYELSKHNMAGHEGMPKKEIKHVITRKVKGGHVHTHVHTHPAHPDEDHVSMGNDGLVDHMLEHQGEPNPGEAEADAGQSGISAAGAAPNPMAQAAGMAGA